MLQEIHADDVGIAFVGFHLLTTVVFLNKLLISTNRGTIDEDIRKCRLVGFFLQRFDEAGEILQHDFATGEAVVHEEVVSQVTEAASAFAKDDAAFIANDIV